MNALGLFLLLLGISSVSMSLVRPRFPRKYHRCPPYSCNAIKLIHPRALSGLYEIAVGNTLVTVYCEMSIKGGGFTFIPRDAVLRGTVNNLVRQLFTDRSQVLLRFQNKDGLQPYTLIRQLPQNSRIPLGLRMHNYFGYTRPQNYYMRDYLYLGILPAKSARNNNIQGFLSNAQKIQFRNCDKNPNSYFALFPNHREQAISNYHGGNLIYERQGVAVNWRKTGTPSFAHRQVPNDFLFLAELHFGGCGCYTSSNRWVKAFGTAIGIK